VSEHYGTHAQKAEAIADLLRTKPWMSLRAIGRVTSTSHTQVARIRDELGGNLPDAAQALRAIKKRDADDMTYEIQRLMDRIDELERRLVIEETRNAELLAAGAAA
jgi:hypothetical protein